MDSSVSFERAEKLMSFTGAFESKASKSVNE